MASEAPRQFRLAVISDVHGNLLALETVLADIKSRGVDATVNLGDCVTSPLWPRETLELLQGLKLPTVRGNHDRWIVERPYDQLSPAGQFAYQALEAHQRSELGALPKRLEFSSEILLVHGTPDDDDTYLLEEVVDGRFASARREVVAQRLGSHRSAAVVLCGHSHNASLRQVPGGPLILNPGSVGCPAFADRPHARTLEYRSPHARYAILTRREGRWGAEMYALEYDWTSASRRAADNGRADWAETIATGALS